VWFDVFGFDCVFVGLEWDDLWFDVEVVVEFFLYDVYVVVEY